MDRTAKHLVAIWAFLISTVPGAWAAFEFAFMPRIEAAIQETIREEIRAPGNREFIECMINVSANKQLYAETSEDLAMFERAEPKRSYHLSEIRRLTDKKNLELATMITDHGNPCHKR